MFYSKSLQLHLLKHVRPYCLQMFCLTLGDFALCVLYLTCYFLVGKTANILPKYAGCILKLLGGNSIFKIFIYICLCVSRVTVNLLVSVS